MQNKEEEGDDQSFPRHCQKVNPVCNFLLNCGCLLASKQQSSTPPLLLSSEQFRKINEMITNLASSWLINCTAVLILVFTSSSTEKKTIYRAILNQIK
jgi:hypothetical protein